MEKYISKTIKLEEIKITKKEYNRENEIRFYGVFLEHIKTGICTFASDEDLIEAYNMALKDLEGMMEIHIENKY